MYGDTNRICALMTTFFYITISVLSVSLMALIGLVFLSLKESLLKKLLPFFVSFAVGALFANVFLHLLPEIVESAADPHDGLLLVLVGIVGSFLLERVIHWHHCHHLGCSHAPTVGTMMLIGDGLHNLMDGILIATAYLVDVDAGIATTIAVLLHEIPQEIGDFAVMLHSGWSRGKALFANFVSALMAVVGAGLVMLMHETIGGVEGVLLPLIAGNFIYIAGSDLVPALHKEKRFVKSLMQATAMVLGIVLMYGVFSFGADAHGHSEDGVHEEEIHMEDDHEVH